MHVVSISLGCEGAGLETGAEGALVVAGAGWVDRGMALVAPHDSRSGRICFPMGVLMRRYINKSESFLPVVDW